MNALLCANLTPLWRALLHKLLRKPLPFEVGAAPSEPPSDPQPGPGQEGVLFDGREARNNP
ncbi:hypothetical protein GCM10009743_64260 [Kribbella swartbergensis]